MGDGDPGPGPSPWQQTRSCGPMPILDARRSARSGPPHRRRAPEPSRVDRDGRAAVPTCNGEQQQSCRARAAPSAGRRSGFRSAQGTASGVGRKGIGPARRPCQTRKGPTGPAVPAHGHASRRRYCPGTGAVTPGAGELTPVAGAVAQDARRKTQDASAGTQGAGTVKQDTGAGRPGTGRSGAVRTRRRKLGGTHASRARVRSVRSCTAPINSRSENGLPRNVERGTRASAAASASSA
jgi:hypothetical protein